MVEVDPAAHARHGTAPFADVAHDHGAAGFVERGDAVFADPVGAGDAEGLLGERLDGEAVAVPAEAALDMLATHRLVARDDVLDCAGEQMAVVRKTRGERRAVVEDEGVAVLRLLQALRKSVVLLPEGEDLLFHPVEVCLVRNGVVHGGSSVSGADAASENPTILAHSAAQGKKPLREALPFL